MPRDQPTQDLDLDPEHTALVLVEFQKQWTESGVYNLLIRRFLRRQDILPRARETVRAARAAGIPVVHAPLRIDPDERKGWLATLTFGRVFTDGTEKAEFARGLYESVDLVVEGRYTFDAFAGSNLGSILAANDVDTVLFAGFTTETCVARSLSTALDRGYDAYLLADLTASWSALLHRRTERRFADRVTTSRVLRDDAAVSTAPAGHVPSG
jgi:nicotinamidase-related amidase